MFGRDFGVLGMFACVASRGRCWVRAMTTTFTATAAVPRIPVQFSSTAVGCEPWCVDHDRVMDVCATEHFRLPGETAGDDISVSFQQERGGGVFLVISGREALFLSGRQVAGLLALMSE